VESSSSCRRAREIAWVIRPAAAKGAGNGAFRFGDSRGRHRFSARHPVSFETVPLPLFATQMLLPSNASAYGTLPTGKLPWEKRGTCPRPSRPLSRR
jgi:hypothetical protein